MLVHIQEKMYALHQMLPEMEKSAEHNASLSKESQTYIEMMLHQTEKHYQEMKNYHQIGLRLSELSYLLSKQIQKFRL